LARKAIPRAAIPASPPSAASSTTLGVVSVERTWLIGELWVDSVYLALDRDAWLTH
jgi:hypothetical protein